MKFKSLVSLGRALAVVAAVLAVGTVSAADKVGFVYVGPVGDYGWSYRHDIGRQSVAKAFGDKVKTTFVEDVKDGADAERVIRQMAAHGHKLIFVTSFGFMNPMMKVAKLFPQVKFEHVTGYKRANNVSTYSGRKYEGRYVVGKIAGMMTKSNIIGYVAAFPIPEVIRGINAVALAASSVNPDIQVKVILVNSWYDPGKEGDAAKALIDQGADIIMQHTDSPVALQVAQSRGVWGVGQSSDMKVFAPEWQLTAIIDNWDAYYIERTQAALDGSWKSQDVWGGLQSKMIELAKYNDAIPADVVNIAEATKAAIIDGSLKPFAGPFNKQDGTEAVAAGEELDDDALLGMDWYVEGVQGKLPNS